MSRFKCAYKELVDVHLLVENPKNPNTHPERQIELLAKIIAFQGQRSPVVVSTRSGFIVKGHGRLQAMRHLGWSQVAVDYQDYESEAQEYADMVADNKIAELAVHDDSMMIEELRVNPELADLDIELLGMESFDLNQAEKVKNTSAELDVNDFDNFDHQCPKCGFEWNDNGQNNS